jgi:hypothetical protein
MGNHRWGLHNGKLNARDIVLEHDFTVEGDLNFGDASVDTFITKGRMATGTIAGANIELGASYTYGELWEIKSRITSWTGIGSSFKGYYFRAENYIAGSGKGLRTTEFYAADYDFGIDNLQVIYADALLKGGSTAVTYGKVNAGEFCISPETGAGAITITTRMSAIELCPSSNGRITGGNLAKIHGMYIMARDGDGGSTALGTGITMVSDPDQSGTRTFTDGIKISIGCVDSIEIAGAATNGINISGATTTGLNIAGNATIGIKLLTGTFGTGINLGGTLTTGVTIGACTTAYTITGTVTTGYNIAGNATDAFKVTSGTIGSGLNIAGGTITTGVNISGAAGTGISISGATTTGISITGSATTAISIQTGTYSTGIYLYGTTSNAIIVGPCSNGLSFQGAITTAISIPSTVTGTGLSISGGSTSFVPIQVGTKASTSGTGFKLVGDTDNSGGVQIYAEDGGVALTADVAAGLRSRSLITTSHSSGKSSYGLFGQMVTNGSLTLTTGNFGAAYIFNQIGSGLNLVTSATSMGINQATTVANGTLTVGAGCTLAGIGVNIRGAGSITNNGTCAGILIASSETTIWPNGIQIANSGATTGIRIGSCTTGIAISGTGATAASKAFSTVGWTVNNANFGDGYGAVECDLALTGTTTGHTAALSSWMNIGSGTASGLVCAQTNGVWESGATISGATVIFGMRMQSLCTQAPGESYPFSIVSAVNVVTALIQCNDSISDLGRTTDVGVDTGTLVPLYKDNTGVKYVKIYSHS